MIFESHLKKIQENLIPKPMFFKGHHNNNQFLSECFSELLEIQGRIQYVSLGEERI